MKIKTCIILFVLVSFLMLVSGCTDSAPAPVTPTTVVAKYQAGDVIAKSSASTTSAIAVQSYDPNKDSYVIYDVSKNPTSQWVKSGSVDPRQLPRTATEKLYIVKVGSIGNSQSTTSRSTYSSSSKSSISPAATSRTDNQDFTFVQIITYYNDDGSITKMTKNKITKTMTIDIKYMYKKSDSTQLSDQFVTELTCGIYTIVFDKTRLEGLIQMSNNWKSQKSTITDDSPQDQQETVPQENPFDGYTVTFLKAEIFDAASQQKISECTITGPNKSDISITYS